MGEVTDVQNVEYLCRLCLSTDEPRSSVFADRASAVSLATKIQACLSIEVLASDKLSTSICAGCLTRVNKWHSYKESCLRSQEKLQRCLTESATPHLPSIKTEPMDFDEPPGSLETVPLTSDDEWESLADERNETSDVGMRDRAQRHVFPRESLTVKREAVEEDSRKDTENDSAYSPELLPNPMAIASSKEDRVMEADSTQKLPTNPKGLRSPKKKVRRGPSTHYRAPRKFRQRCEFCQIHLHSKNSYGRHMKRFHSDGKPEAKPGPTTRRKRQSDPLPAESKRPADEPSDVGESEEMVEDVEDELISLEKDAPLTPVQQNIISQLKTFSCYSCEQSFQDRRSTLNHIRQHMPDLRPYTCIACLTEFADRSIYKLHCGASFQCAMKIALVVPEHGTERYFTCNMCLRPLSNRRELMSHLSKHSDKQYEQLIGGSFRSPPKLKPVSPIATPASPSRSTVEGIPVPYMNGDPARNNLCVYCGMIYKHKQNLARHVDLCEKLPVDGRISYRCVQCGVTFLAFGKYHSHLRNDHRTSDLSCSHCFAVFPEPNGYLEHYRQHRPREFRLEAASSASSGRRNIGTTETEAPSFFGDEAPSFFGDETPSFFGSEPPKGSSRWSCALCPGSKFPTRAQLTEHRKVHPKLKIYSCSICRRMFGGAGALESHMTGHARRPGERPANASTRSPADGDDAARHGVEVEVEVGKLSRNSDPGASSGECHACGKVFASYQNLRRHVRNMHEAPGRYSCFSCPKVFGNQRDWTEHAEVEHPRTEETVACPICDAVFPGREEMTTHRRETHGNEGEDTLSCYICGKIFQSLASLRIHRGHHFRVNSRLSIGKIGQDRGAPLEDDDDPISNDRGAARRLPAAEGRLPVKTPRARKSFPNGSPARPLPSALQCQVCNDRFNDVSNLRKHLWDVHCARNKPEKEFPSEKLQCGLCTNVLPDEESMRSHVKWHEGNPILGDKAAKKEARVPAECDLCGKFYSSVGNLMKHKKRHKLLNLSALKLQPKGRWGGVGFTCNCCQKVFATNATLKKHRATSHPQGQRGAANGDARGPWESRGVGNVGARTELDGLVERAKEGLGEETKKPVTCNLCRKLLPSRQELYKHRSVVHKVTRGGVGMNGVTDESRVACTACSKFFSTLTNMRQHFTKVHGNMAPKYRCTVDGCELLFRSYGAKRDHERSHVNVSYACPVCPRRVVNRATMIEHINRDHKPNSSVGNGRKNEKSTALKKINLDNYIVKGANGRQCPMCKINYPNYKTLKTHYLKVHEVVF